MDDQDSLGYKFDDSSIFQKSENSLSYASSSQSQEVRSQRAESHPPRNVNDFLKQSNQIQAEIHRLSKLCQQISPEHNQPTEEDDSDEMWEESQEEGEVQWAQINQLLQQFGFPAVVLYQDEDLQEVPDLKSLGDVFWDLLNEYGAKQQESKDHQRSLKALQHENRELAQKFSRVSSDSHREVETQLKQVGKQNRALTEKLHKVTEACRERESVINQLRDQLELGGPPHKSSEEREKNIFRAFMHREFNPNKDTDAKVLGIIVYYEDLRHKATSSYHDPKITQQLEAQNKQLKAELSHLKAKGSHQELLKQIAHDLSVESIEEIPAAVKKMQQVLLRLPNIERFLEAVCKTINEDRPNLKLEETLSVLKSWKESQHHVRLLLSKLNASGSEALDRADAISYFCDLFEVATSPVRTVVEQVYYFVHEIKVFLSVRLTQFARRTLGLPSDTNVKIVLERISSLILYQSSQSNYH